MVGLSTSQVRGLQLQLADDGSLPQDWRRQNIDNRENDIDTTEGYSTGDSEDDEWEDRPQTPAAQLRLLIRKASGPVRNGFNPEPPVKLRKLIADIWIDRATLGHSDPPEDAMLKWAAENFHPSKCSSEGVARRVQWMKTFHEQYRTAIEEILAPVLEAARPYVEDP